MSWIRQALTSTARLRRSAVRRAKHSTCAGLQHLAERFDPPSSQAEADDAQGGNSVQPSVDSPFGELLSVTCTVCSVTGAASLTVAGSVAAHPPSSHRTTAAARPARGTAPDSPRGAAHPPGRDRGAVVAALRRLPQIGFSGCAADGSRPTPAARASWPGFGAGMSQAQGRRACTDRNRLSKGHPGQAPRNFKGQVAEILQSVRDLPSARLRRNG